MSFIGKNELKHLLRPDTGEWVGEFDPIFETDSACATCVGATTKTIKTVSDSKDLFAYAFIVSNETTDTDATYAILKGATIMIPPIMLIRQDVHLIPTAPNPRSPILHFASGEPINIRTGGATINVTMSFWEVEFE